MFKPFACTCAALVMLAPGIVTLAAPGQDRPGQPTKAQVWVENRGAAEAVPVILQEVTGAKPLGVQVIGTPTVNIPSNSRVQAVLIRQPWEYRTVTVPPGQDFAKAIDAAGMDGWEVTGIQVPNASSTTLLLKRPR